MLKKLLNEHKTVPDEFIKLINFGQYVFEFCTIDVILGLVLINKEYDGKAHKLDAGIEVTLFTYEI